MIFDGVIVTTPDGKLSGLLKEKIWNMRCPSTENKKRLWKAKGKMRRLNAI
jgi:hypothetical protein